MRPGDKDAKSKYSECSKIVNRLAFERAIAVESDKKPITDTLNLDAMSKNDFTPRNKNKVTRHNWLFLQEVLV